MTDVVVVGGGLAGLFTAVALVDRGVDDVVVLEGADAPGGIARTLEVDGRSLEPAVGSTLLPHPDLTPLLAGLGVGTIPAVSAGVRHVWTGDRLVTLAPGPAALTAPLVSPLAKARAAGEVAVRSTTHEDESLDAFMRRRFGAAVGRIGAWLASSGVYAGDPSELSAADAFPRLAALEQSGGSVVRGMVRAMRSRPAGAPRPTIHTIAGGTAAIADAAAARLGDRLRTGTTVSSVRRMGDGWEVDGTPTRSVVLACAPDRAAALVDGDLRATLSGRPTAPVAVVWLGGPTDRFPVPDGFGILTGPGSRMHTRGVLLESSYAPHRTPAGTSLVKVIAGGRPTTGETAAGVVDRVGTEVARILGHDLEADFAHVVHHHPGIPQYVVGHRRWREAVEALCPPGLWLTGWAYRGVGITHIASDAVRVAGTVAQDLGA